MTPKSKTPSYKPTRPCRIVGPAVRRETRYFIRWTLPNGAVRENHAELFDTATEATTSANYLLNLSTSRIAPLMRRWYASARFEIVPVTVKIGLV